MDEEKADRNERRKRKSTPKKLRKTMDDKGNDNNDKNQVENSVKSTSESKDSDVAEDVLVDKSSSKKGILKAKRGPKAKKDNTVAETKNRTAYKRSWRLNQPMQKCPECSYETRDKESYRSHMKKHDPAAEKFVCRYCEKTFRSKRGFIRHQNIHLQPDRIHKCPLCPYLTPLRSTMVQHMGAVHRADLEGKPLTGKFKCEDCDFSCLFECQLKIHRIRKHNKERPFKCNECEYSAVLKADLDKHISIKHRFERPYMCEVCGFRSQSQGGYNRHKRSHTGEKPYSCSICGKQYADSRKFKIHVLRHEKDEKPFACHLCGHACRRKDNLKMHLKRIHKTELTGQTLMEIPEDTRSLVLNDIGNDTLSIQRHQQDSAIQIVSVVTMANEQQIQETTIEESPEEIVYF